MLAEGRTVLSQGFDLGEVGVSVKDASYFFNKYSIHSMMNELRWALERDSFPAQELLFQVGPDEYADFQLGFARLKFPADKIMEFRRAYLNGMARVVDADVVIVTLGYVETWFDKKLGIYMNNAPSFQFAAKEPHRFEFRVLSYSDVLQGLNDLFDLLNKYRKKPMKMLITVSPVPLASTFRQMDVLVANQYSKSVQRAAIEEFVQGKQGVDYFPSYEFVTLSNPMAAWAPQDYRHVTNTLISNIMADVQDKYAGRPNEKAGRLPMTVENLAASATMLRKVGDPAAGLTLINRHRNLADRSSQILNEETMLCEMSGDPEGVYIAAGKLLAKTPDFAIAIERMIVACRDLGKVNELAKWAEVHAQAHPDRSDTLGRLLNPQA
jgi:hypothetical protein